MATLTTPLKLLLSYDVKPDQLQEYYQFVLGRYIPQVQAMGLEVSEAWHTGYGNWPNRLIGFVLATIEHDLPIYFRRRGVGKALIEHAAADLAGAGVRHLRVRRPRRMATPAPSFKRCGFRAGASEMPLVGPGCVGIPNLPQQFWGRWGE